MPHARIWLVLALVAACGGGTPGNRPPVAGDVALTTPEDTPLSVALPGTDPDGDVLRWTATAPIHGRLDGVAPALVYTPDAEFHGDDALDITVTDGEAVVTARVAITVAAVADPPVAGADAAATDEDVVLTIPVATLLANDRDADGDGLTITGVADVTGGAAVVDGDVVRFAPGADINGAGGFTYIVSDGALTATGQVAISIAPVNDAPVAQPDAFVAVEDAQRVIQLATLIANDTDVDGDALQVTAVGDAVNGTVAISGTVVLFTPTPDVAGTGSFTYTVSDGAATAVGTVTLDISGVNDAPVVGADTLAAAEDTPLVIAAATLLTNDHDVDGDALVIADVTAPHHGVVALVGTTITFTPDANYAGDADFTYAVSDGTATVTGLVRVVVGGQNDPPVAGADAVTTAEDTPLVLATAALIANDTDADGQTLAVTAVGGATGGAVALVGTTVTFTPDADVTGAASFTYTVTDGIASATGTVAITITPIPDAPVAVADTRPAMLEDGTLVLPTSALLANDTDVDSPSLTVIAVGDPSTGTVSLSGTTITFTPAANANGTATFTYTISDGALTATATVTVPITAVDDPIVAVADSLTGTEDTPVVVPVATIVGNDLEPDGQPRTITGFANQNGLGAAIAGGTLTLTPQLNRNGTTWIDYTVSDGVTSSTARITVTLAAVNDAPVVTNDDILTTEDTSVTVAIATLLANDYDDDGDAVTFVSIGAAPRGTAVVTGASITFTPAADDASGESFPYTITDGQLTRTGVVTIYPVAVNDPPVAVDDALTMFEDTPYSLDTNLLKINDVDPDTEFGALTVTSVTGDAHCSVTLAGTVATITPVAEYGGPCALGYTLSDGQYADTGAIAVTVTPVDDRPIARDDAFATVAQTTIAIPASALLANDTDIDSTLAVVEVGNEVGGALAFDGTTIRYAPAAGFVGTGSFTYRAAGDSYDASATVTITVTAGSCGDGNVSDVEDCDDGNAIDDDGCTSACVTGVVCDATAFPGADGYATDPDTGRCYVRFATGATWPTARAACQALGGDLLVPGSASEETVALELGSGWLGLSDWLDEGVFRMVGGGAPTYTHWGSGEPNNFNGLEDCGEQTGGGTWNDIGCGSPRAYTCEIGRCGDGTRDAGESCDDGNRDDGDGCSNQCVGAARCGDGTIDAGEACDDGNLDDDDGCTSACVTGAVCDLAAMGTEAYQGARVDPATGHCYLLAYATGAWASGQSTCAALGGHLALPDDASENSLIGGLAGAGTVWLGATDAASEGTWRDTAGALLAFVNWAGGEPNDSGGDEDCAMMWADDTWNDGNCASASGIVCELE